MTWALDLDGVVWLGDKVIPGVGESITRLREEGEQVFFVTNNSGRTEAEVEEKLKSFNIEPDGGVITSAMAMATLLNPGETVLTICGRGAIEEMKKGGSNFQSNSKQLSSGDVSVLIEIRNELKNILNELNRH